MNAFREANPFASVDDYKRIERKLIDEAMMRRTFARLEGRENAVEVSKQQLIASGKYDPI